MFGWFKRKLQIKIAESFRADINRFNASLKGASANEVALVVVFSNFWRDRLEAHYGWNLDSPDLVIAKDVSAALKLNGLIKDVQKKDPAYATGLMVWLHTIRATQTPEIRIHGREMWAQLARGMPHVERAAADFRNLTGKTLSVVGIDRTPDNLGVLLD